MTSAVGSEEADHVVSLADALLAWFPARPTRTLVAFSGGADSALVLAAAAKALGADLVVAATAVSPSLASGEMERAVGFAQSLDVAHRAVPTREMDVEGYRANGIDRCYFCKATLLDELLEIAAEQEFEMIVTGTNGDDVRAGFRPGIRAAHERGARAPLAELQIAKRTVRAISKLWGLSTWDKPAMPCLSSRIAYGIQITPARLRRIDDAEGAIRGELVAAGLQPRGLRVRDLGERVRVEIDPDLVEVVLDNSCANTIREIVKRSGFGPVDVTIEPFISGSLNHVGGVEPFDGGSRIKRD